MTFIGAIKTCLKHEYFTFSGRASRPEFWYFVLFVFLGMLLCTVVNSLLFGPEVTQHVFFDADGNPTGDPSTEYSYNGGIFSTIFGLAILIPWLAVTWRRMHDSGRRGWLPFVPFGLLIAYMAGLVFADSSGSGVARWIDPFGGATPILLFLAAVLVNCYWLTYPSDPEANAYGPHPKDAAP